MLLTYASAGQYIGFSLYALNAGLAQLIILTIITNARYILMGVTLNQRMPEGTPFLRRLAVGTCITDEIFGITVARPGVPSPYYSFGAWSSAVPMWAVGTAIGITMGNILPARLVSALSVAIFGMFLAVIIPPARKDKVVGAAVLVSFACSYAAAHLPGISDISQGTRTILLTLVIASVFAIAVPRADDGGAASGGTATDDDAAAAGVSQKGGGAE